MQASNFWHQFPIHRRSLALLFLLLCLCLSAQAQRYKWARQNNPLYDERRITYGFVLGLHSSGYQVSYSDQFVTQSFDTVHSVMAPKSPGFSLGFLVNLRLNEVLDLRLMPKAGFYDHVLEYNYTDDTQQEQLIETTLLEFPLLLKYKSMRRGNVRMYVVGGLTPSFELSGKNDVESSSANLDIRNTNFTLDAGLGFDFYFPFFKFSQEIRFSRGLPDMIGPTPSPFREPLSRLNTNTIAVYFIFQ